MLNIYRSGTIIYSVDIDETTRLTYQLMAEQKVDSNWVASAPMDIRLGDYILIGLEKYYLNTAPDFEKVNNITYVYQAVWEAEAYKMYRKILIDEGAAQFSYFGDVDDYLNLLVANMNEIDPGWTYSIGAGLTDVKPLAFDQESCRVALGRICEEFAVQFRLVQRHITIAKSIGVDTLYEFEYGKGKGLYSLTRESVQDQGVVTRLYVFGGEKNLNFDYRDAARRLVFELRKLEANIDIYGIREGSVTFPDIFPNRTGSVTSTADPNSFVDTSLDFDINSFLLEGQTAKVVFKSGSLNGYEFEIKSYDHATKTVTFLNFTEANDYILPNEISKPEDGDLYTLVDINMPPSYIAAAEAKLFIAGQEHLDKVKSPAVTYTLEIDPKYIRQNGVELQCGHRVRVKDAALGLSEMIRIYSISFPLLRPDKITAEIADSVAYTVQERVRKDVAKQEKITLTIDRRRAENFRQSTTRLRALQNLVFDQDDYFDTERIKPESIETISLAVGQKSQNFGLTDVTLEANVGDDPNRFDVSGGELVHYEYEIEGLGFIWEIDPASFPGLTPGQVYRLYARCSKAALIGTWVLSPEPIKTEAEAGFWHFYVGALLALNSGLRAFEFTKGMTFVNGDSIVTGSIRSLDGLNYFDLTQGTFKLGDTEQSIDWGVTAAGQLTINGVLVTKMAFVDDAEIINLIVKNLRTNLTGKRIEIIEAENSLKFYNTDGDLVLQIDDSLGTDLDGNTLAGVRINNPDNGRTAYVAGTGIFSNASRLPFISATSGLDTNASIAGLLFERNTDPDGISAGVAGIDATTTGASESYGGFFNSMKALGLFIGVVTTTADITLTRFQTFVSCYNDPSGITVTLMASPRVGKTYFIKRINTAGVTIDGGAADLVFNGSPVGTHAIANRGETVMLVWDGSYWQGNVI
jgi:hypothetical protein